MLNRGPSCPNAIEVLDDIVARMQGHLDKRAPMLRRLAVAGALAGESAISGDRD